MVRYSEHRSFFLSALTCIALSACGGGGSGGGDRDRDAQPVLTSLSVSPAELTLEALGATAQLEATARDQNGNALSAQFTWGSSDTVVVTVDADGLVTALNNGTTMVTVRSGGVSASVSVTVEQAPASIALSGDEVVLTALEATEQLQASVFDANDRAMAAEVTWASSDAAVASVDEDGGITGHANGTATVTASTTATAGAVSATAAVTVMQVLDRITVAPDDILFTAIGESARVQVMALDANGYPMNLAVSLSSSEPAVASVDSTGLVTAQANGMATVTATIGMLSDSVVVTVNQQVVSVSVAPTDTPTLDALGATVQLQAIAQDANGHTVSVEFDWDSSDPAIATVDENGLVTAQANGTASITATTGMLSDSVAVTVEQQVAGVSIAPPDSDSLDAIGVTVQLQAAAQDANGHTVSVEFDWASSDPAIAAVDANGLVTAQANGTTTVTATAGALSGSIAVNVDQQVTGVSVAPPDADTFNAIGAAVQLRATAHDANGHNVAVEFDWDSSDPAIATVDENGLVTARANGTVTVTATAGMLSDSITLTVGQQVDSVILTPLYTDALEAVGATVQLQAVARDANRHTVNVEFDWASSDPTIASVDPAGLVTAQANGIVSVTATVRGQGRKVSASVAITVQVRPPPRETLTIRGDPNVSDPRTGRTPLHIAAMANAPRLITALVTAGVDVEARDRDGHTALHAAAAANATAAIAVLLDAGADVDAHNRLGETPLQYALSESPEDVAAAIAGLLNGGADPNVRDSLTGRTPLHRIAWAARTGSTQLHRRVMSILTALLDAGADPNARDDFGQTALYRAVLNSAAAATITLLEAGADPNARDNDDWLPLLIWVASAEDPAILTALLDAGADIQSRDNVGTPLLHLAAARDNPAAIAALLDAGADIAARDSAGGTALHAAAGSTEVGAPVAASAAIAALLDAGVDTTARDNSGITAMQRVAARSRGLVTALLEAHAGQIVQETSARDTFGYTALHAAARANSQRLIVALLESGAEIDALDDNDYTPLLLAAGTQRSPEPLERRNVPPATFNPAAIRALAAAGADLEARNQFSHTALQQAAFWDETATIAVLVEAGANLAARERNGLTALQIAMGSGHMAAIVALAEAEAELEVGDYGDFAAVVALALRNPAALVESGLDPNARDDRGRTVLHWAVGWHDAAALAATRALVEAGASPNVRDHSGRTPMQQAAARRNTQMIAALADVGADMNVHDARGRTLLHIAVIWGDLATVAALAATGADLEARDADGWTALQLAAYRGNPAKVAALAEAGADLEARDDLGRTALQLAANRVYAARAYNDPSTATTVAALLEAGANPDAVDNNANTPLHGSAATGNQSATGLLRVLGANWTSDPDADLVEANPRFVAVELFQGPMVWHWEPGGTDASTAGPNMSEGSFSDHAKTLLHRAMAVAVRVGSENPDPMPELSVSLSDADGRAWPVHAAHVQGPYIVSLNSESGLWETEYVYELPVEWVESGHRASFVIDPYNRLSESDESDNVATLTVDGYAAPVFDITFVPIELSGDFPFVVDTDVYMAGITDLLPIGEYRAQVGSVLDLSGRNIAASNMQLVNNTALSELLRRWNAEAGENEYYYGLLPTPFGSLGFGGRALLGGPVSISDPINHKCDVERSFCGGVHAHELGHNLGLSHAPGGCDEVPPIDPDYPYAGAGIGPRRGWAASRNEFASSQGSGSYRPYRDVMSYCGPAFVSDYNYNKMMNNRLGGAQSPTDGTERIGPSLKIGSDLSSSSFMPAPTAAYAPPPGAASASGASASAREVGGMVEDVGPSLAFTGAVDEYGLWSIYRIDASTQAPRSTNTAGEYFFTLQDAFQREIYREPMSLLTPVHGGPSRSWAVRVPVPEDTPVFLAILDAQGTPLFIEPIDMPADVRLEE